MATRTLAFSAYVTDGTSRYTSATPPTTTVAYTDGTTETPTASLSNGSWQVSVNDAKDGVILWSGTGIAPGDLPFTKVPADLATLIARLTADRAAKLDRDLAAKADVQVTVPTPVADVDEAALATDLAALLPTPTFSGTVQVSQPAQDTAPIVAAVSAIPVEFAGTVNAPAVDTEALAVELAPLLPAPTVTIPSYVLASRNRTVDGKVKLGEGDTLDPIELVVYDETTHLPIDLTNATATFSMKNELGEKVIDEKAATVVTPATTGKVRYGWSAEDTAQPGKYKARFRITTAEGTFSVPNSGHIDVEVTEL